MLKSRGQIITFYNISKNESINTINHSDYVIIDQHLWLKSPEQALKPIMTLEQAPLHTFANSWPSWICPASRQQWAEVSFLQSADGLMCGGWQLRRVVAHPRVRQAAGSCESLFLSRRQEEIKCVDPVAPNESDSQLIGMISFCFDLA